MSYDKQIYDAAEAELNNRRNSAENEQAARLEEIEKKIPEIKEIYAHLSETIIELSKLIISKKDFAGNFEKIKEKNLQGQQLAAKLLTEHGYSEDYLDVHYHCEKCNDKGYINGQRCSCLIDLLNKYAIEALNRSANMPDCDFEHFSLDYYNNIKLSNGADCRAVMSDILKYCKNYAETFNPNSDSIFMYGKTGVGKTHLSLSIAKAVAAQGHTVAYGSLVNYLTMIEKEHFRKNSESTGDTSELLINTELLILDDLGSEFLTGFTESAIYNIINSRINLGRPTIINTNLSTDELQSKYNDRIISRIFGNYVTLCLMGNDIRQIKRIESYKK